MLGKIEAYFWYYGQTRDKDRKVMLVVGVPSKYHPIPKYSIQVEGMPALTRDVDTREKALGVFQGFHEMAEKEQGSSDIVWVEAPEADWDKRPPHRDLDMEGKIP